MTKRYRKKPVVIEAYQWHSGDGETNGVVNNPTGNPMTPDTYYCQTLEGNMVVSDGDWIIQGVKGEIYPCKPDIFELTYESVD